MDQLLALPLAWVLIPILFSLVLYSQFVWLARNASRRLPPGPWPLPVIGNAHQLPLEYQERTFASWSRKYGDLIYANIFTRPMIIINSQQVARELLDKRSAKYSSRPRFVMIVELLGWYPSAAFLPYSSDRRRVQRRWIQNVFGDKSTLHAYEHIQLRETCILLSSLMDMPHGFAKHIQRYISALIMETVYGHRITSLDDQYITLIERTTRAVVETGAAGGALVDFFPLLKHIPAWLPGMRWKRLASLTRQSIWEAKHLPYLMVRDAVVSGDAQPSMTSALIEDATKRGRLNEEEIDIINAAAVLYSAGTDTTNATLCTFLLAMILHPQVYQKAQEEVDHVIGKDRLPTTADREALPYVDCVIKEVYRWNSPVPLGIPHYLTETDEYRGIRLPGDTSIIANLWSMTQNESIYGDPAVFRPERFLDKTLDSETSDPRNIIFGYGRRVCPGRLFADTTIFLAVASMIATLDIGKARDPAGNEITPSASYVSGFVSHPHDFVCAIKPRSPAAVELVADMMKETS